MADHSAIEWTESTWNPIAGCTAVSAGCDHCYAARQASGRLSRLPLYAGLAVDGTFTGEVRLAPERLDQPLRWKRPRRVFVNSMSDLFHDAVPDEFIARVFAVMAATSQHTYQCLTKRHGRMRSLLNAVDFHRMVAEIAPVYGGRNPDLTQDYVTTAWPLPNVWLGVSVENQQWADIRVPALLDTPAAVRFLSCEPLLGPVNLRNCDALDAIDYLDWVIVGGESGPGARPMHPDWARGVRDQCIAASVPLFFKQWGEWAPAVDLDPDLRERAPEELAGSEYVCRVGKRAAGRELDGRTWDEYPRAAGAVT